MRLTVSPERAPIDEPVSIRLDGQEPGARVTVRARMEGVLRIHPEVFGNRDAHHGEIIEPEST